MKPLSILGLTLLAITVLGCASSPPAESPDLGVDVPEEFTAGGVVADAPRVDLDGLDWWTYFGDRRLDQLIDTALEQNRDLSAAVARVDAAMAQATIAGADLYPQIGAGLSGSRRKQNFIGFPIPGNEANVLSVTSSSFGANLNLSWEVDLWGRLRAQKGAALSRFEASQADFAGAYLSLAGQTAKAWFAVLEANQQVAVADDTYQSRRVSRGRIERRYKLGTRPALDLRFAMTNEEGAKATLAFRNRQLDVARRQLQLLLSKYPDGTLPWPDQELMLPDPPPTLPAGLPSELVTRRPDLLASERRLAAAGLDIKQAKANLYPQLRLTGSAGTLSDDLGGLIDEDLSVWSLAANLLQPVFQGGRLRAGVDLSEARYRELTESYIQLVLRAFGEVETTLAAEEYLAAQEQALEAAAVQSIAAEKLAQQRYDFGLQDFLSVLEAQRNSFLARSELLNARRLRLDNRVDLFLSLGGGFENLEMIASRLAGESDQP